MSKLTPVNIHLSPADHAALSRMAEATEATMSDIVRWAIRHYAASGPWTSRSSIRRRVIRLIKSPMLGPITVSEGGTNGQTA